VLTLGMHAVSKSIIVGWRSNNSNFKSLEFELPDLDSIFIEVLTV